LEKFAQKPWENVSRSIQSNPRQNQMCALKAHSEINRNQFEEEVTGMAEKKKAKKGSKKKN